MRSRNTQAKAADYRQNILMVSTIFLTFAFLLMITVVKSHEKSAFRRGVECSVHWNTKTCGPHTATRSN